MSVPYITPMPTPPSRGRPTEFSPEADPFLGSFPRTQVEMNIALDFVNEKVIETAALVVEAQEIVANAGLLATSTTELMIGAGSKSLTIQPGRAFGVGSWVNIAQTGAPKTNYMVGQVTAHNRETGLLTVNVTHFGGSETYSAWSISVSGPPGANGSDATVTRPAIETALEGTPLLEAAAGATYAQITDRQVTISGTAHTLLPEHNGWVHRFTAATEVTVTLPDDMAEGWNCVWRQIEAGQVVFVTGGGAKPHNRQDHDRSAGQRAEGTLAVDTNDGGAAVYYLGGDTAK